MNQILSTSNNPNNNNTVNLRRIIVIFCAIIIVFGLIIVVKSSYNLYKSRSQRANIDKQKKPEIIIEQLENNIIKVAAKYETGLVKLSYTWNGANKNEINLSGKSYIEKMVEIPSEQQNNTIEIVAQGMDGTLETLTRDFIIENQETLDKKDPELDWAVEKDLNIIAQDETEMAYLTYKWADEEEVMVKANSGDKKIEKTIEIKRGTNELTITAVDTSGNSTSKTRTFKGVKEPEIAWVKTDNIVEMSITHDMGFQKIIFIVNNIEYVYDSHYDQYNTARTEVKFKTELNPGENTIIIKAYSNEGSEKIKEGKATYNP